MKYEHIELFRRSHLVPSAYYMVSTIHQLEHLKLTFSALLRILLNSAIAGAFKYTHTHTLATVVDPRHCWSAETQCCHFAWVCIFACILMHENNTRMRIFEMPGMEDLGKAFDVGTVIDGEVVRNRYVCACVRTSVRQKTEKRYLSACACACVCVYLLFYLVCFNENSSSCCVVASSHMWNIENRIMFRVALACLGPFNDK